MCWLLLLLHIVLDFVAGDHRHQAGNNRLALTFPTSLWTTLTRETIRHRPSKRTGPGRVRIPQHAQGLRVQPRVLLSTLLVLISAFPHGGSLWDTTARHDVLTTQPYDSGGSTSHFASPLIGHEPRTQLDDVHTKVNHLYHNNALRL